MASSEGVVVLVLVALAITCTVYWCSADDDCTKRGGVLVQAPGTWGGYACVAKKR